MKSPIVFLHDIDIEKDIKNIFESPYFEDENFEDFEITQDFLDEVAKEVQELLGGESQDAMMIWSYLNNLISQSINTVLLHTVFKLYTISTSYTYVGKDEKNALKHFFKDYKNIPIERLEWNSEISLSQNSKGMWRKDQG